MNGPETFCLHYAACCAYCTEELDQSTREIPYNLNQSLNLVIQLMFYLPIFLPVMLSSKKYFFNKLCEKITVQNTLLSIGTVDMPY